MLAVPPLRSPRPPRRRRGRLGAAGILAGVLGLVALVGCVSAPPAPLRAPIPPPEATFLRDPATGYPLTDDPARLARLSGAWRELAAGGDPAVADSAAAEVLAATPEHPPARVLRAQVAFLRGDDRTTVDLLRPLVEELPTYAAAALVLGRAAERLGELPRAVDAYLGIADAEPVAARRAAELLPPAIEIVGRQVDEAIARGRLDLADTALARLVRWAPEGPTTLQARRRVAAAAGDAVGELSALRQLAALGPSRRTGAPDPAARELLERLGELEVEVGDLGAGIERFEALAAHHPDDAALRDKLEAAKFRWRLGLLPPAVRETALRPALDRADLATLLYWLVPEVRYSEVRSPPIATDILDHPRREEILRVIDRGLLSVDRVVHQFRPGAPATRATAMRAFLRLLAAAGPAAPCAADLSPATLGDGAGVCRLALRCELLADEAECLPEAVLSGSAAVEMARHTLDLLGSR